VFKRAVGFILLTVVEILVIPMTVALLLNLKAGLGHHIWDLTYPRVVAIGKWSKHSSDSSTLKVLTIDSLYCYPALGCRAASYKVQYSLSIYSHLSKRLVEARNLRLHGFHGSVYPAPTVSGGVPVHSSTRHLEPPRAENCEMHRLYRCLEIDGRIRNHRRDYPLQSSYSDCMEAADEDCKEDPATRLLQPWHLVSLVSITFDG
jgi:hypothetical protein